MHKSNRKPNTCSKVNASQSVPQTRRPYTPPLGSEAVFVLRRLAWATGQPMTTTLNNLVLQAARQASGQYVCGSCKGSKDQCPGCLFKEQASQAGIVAERPQP